MNKQYDQCRASWHQYGSAAMHDVGCAGDRAHSLRCAAAAAGYCSR